MRHNLTRQAGWEERLSLTIREGQAKRFQWGSFDCFTFAADCVLALTGQDVMEGIRGQYTDQSSAMVYLNELGADRDYWDIERAVSHFMGYEPGRAAYAKRGDIILMAQEGIPVRLAVSYGGRAVSPRYAGDGHGGLGAVPYGCDAKAWML